MSHFKVLVIGPDVEGQLEPYDEGIQVAPYRVYDDPEWLFRLHQEKVSKQTRFDRAIAEIRDSGRGETADILVGIRDSGGCAGCELGDDGLDIHTCDFGTGREVAPTELWQKPTPEELVAWLNDRWEDEGWFVDEMGIYHLSTYSQNSKWDWYTVGGRWRGFFKLTAEAMDRATLAKVGDPGMFDNEPTFDADVVLRGDVDAEAMRSASGVTAGDQWDRAHALFAGTPEPDSWATVRERHPKNVDAARVEYHEQPRVKAVRDHDAACREEERRDDALLRWDGHIETFDVSREEFVRRARDNAICPYAYLRNGEWFAPGEMGWWGMSSDTDEDRARFAREFNKMFDALPDDAILTMCDLHI